MPLYDWSTTAASNATADATINWAEGQAPSTVNDSARSMMARIAEYRDDIAGAIVTGGTSTAYTLTSHQVFDTLAHMHGQIIAFTANPTNAATVTLNVDGLGAKPLRSSASIELPAGVLISGTPYVAIYNNTDGAFYLQGFFGNPYNIPLAGGIDYWGASAPNSSFAFPYGQAISRTTYSSLFALMGTTNGVGDGSTTFNLPDLRGRTRAAPDSMGGSAAGRLTAISSGVGSNGGAQTVALTTDQIPSHSHANTLTDPGHTHPYITGVLNTSSGTFFLNIGGGSNPAYRYDSAVSANLTGMTINNVNAGGGGSHQNVQPTIICNYIIRIT